MRKFLPLLLAAFLGTTAIAQRAGRGFSVKNYGNNIFKITYTLPSDTHGELVSDAVILSPQKDDPAAAIKRVGDTVYLRGQPLLFDAYIKDGDRGFSFPLRPGEAIFGGGERALPLNRRGYLLPLYNNPWYGYSEGADDINFSVPFIVSSAGYALFFDNPSRGMLDIGKTDPTQIHYKTASGELNVYVLLGDFQQILQHYHILTGTQPLPPRWAFGNLMSRFGYTSEKQVDSIAAAMRQKNIPIDAVIFDLFWFGDSIKGTMGNLDWVNRTAWSDPKAMIGRFKEQGIHTVLVTEPFFLTTTKNYAAAKPFLAKDKAGAPYLLRDFYFGRGGLLDIFRPDAQSWFWQFYKKQISNGVDGWWGDLGEPEKHPDDLYHRLPNFKRPFGADEVHNLYGHTWTKMLAQRYAKEFPGQRLFSLNRAGFAGSQRYSIFPWTGDVSRSWSGLRAQLPVLLGMAMSGIPYVHSDAGGFAGGSGDYELYIRWLQFAVYTPVFRPHGTALFGKDPGAFSFPSEAALMPAPYDSLAREAIRQRYRLLPYNYSLAYGQAKMGTPLLAPLYYYFGRDTATFSIQDEFMWGEQILVAPVLEPAPAKGLQTRRYYLPAGDWYEPSKDRWKSGGWQTDTLTLTDMPVLYRAGAFIPQANLPVANGRVQATNTAGYRSDTLRITYVGSDELSIYRWYDDDGKSPDNLKTGRYDLIDFAALGRSGDNLGLDIRSGHTGAGWPSRPKQRHLLLEMVFKGPLPSYITVNGNRQPFTQQEGKIVLPVNFDGRRVQIYAHW